MKITTAIESYLKSSFDREESTTEKKFYVSDMGKCMRVRWLKRKGIATEFEPHVYWILQMGTLCHDYGYKALESQGILLEAEESVETEHFKGRFDGIVKNGDERCIFDFKTVGGYKMKKIIDGEDDEENIAQLLTYTMLFQGAGKDVGNTAFVVYINKEVSNKIPVPFFQKEYHLTKWRKEKLEEEMNTITKFWMEDKIPPCSCPGWMRDYNSFQPFCSMDDKHVKSVLKIFEKGKETGKKMITTNKEILIVDGDKREVLKV
jgi:CRISPR/Cas system-associated exonuclease Cas4 (RecB family)